MIDHDGIEHSGYMSFMVLLSIFPFFIFILAFTGFFGASELGEKFIQLALENRFRHRRLHFDDELNLSRIDALGKGVGTQRGKRGRKQEGQTAER